MLTCMIATESACDSCSPVADWIRCHCVNKQYCLIMTT